MLGPSFQSLAIAGPQHVTIQGGIMKTHPPPHYAMLRRGRAVASVPEFGGSGVGCVFVLLLARHPSDASEAAISDVSTHRYTQEGKR